MIKKSLFSNLFLKNKYISTSMIPSLLSTNNSNQNIISYNNILFNNIREYNTNYKRSIRKKKNKNVLIRYDHQHTKTIFNNRKTIRNQIFKNNTNNLHFENKKLKFYKVVTGAHVLYDKLLEHNVQDAFIYSGGAIMPLVDCFYDGPINYYVNTHEQNCGHAATGYAKSTNRTGICIVTSGPGLTNIVTPMLDATNDSTPLIVLSGQVPVSALNTDAFQECPAVEISKPVTKWSYQVKHVSEIPAVIDAAFYIANDGKKGAVHIDLPKCILSEGYKHNPNVTKEIFLEQNNIDMMSHMRNLQLTDYVLREVAELIYKSERPIIYAGQGCNNSPGILDTFINEINIPITTTIHGMGVYDEKESLSLQFLGMHGNPAANYAIQESDLIIALGSRFDDRTTGNLEKYAPEALKASQEGRGGIIHVDIEPKQHNKVVKADINIVSDVGVFLSKLMPFMEYKPRSKWLLRCLHSKKRYPFTYLKSEKDEKKIKTQDVICALQDFFDKYLTFKRYIITTGVGNHQMMAAQFIKWRYPKSFITSGSLGVMGVGLPYAIGCQIANPDKLVIDIDGDGSFNHTMSDLKTAVEHKLPIKIMIMNDGHQSMVRVWEKLFYNNRITATTLERNPNYAELAESFGAKGIVCNNRDDLDKCISEMMSYKGGPIVCDFKVESDYCFPLVAPGKGLHEMITAENLKNQSFFKLLPPN